MTFLRKENNLQIMEIQEYTNIVSRLSRSFGPIIGREDYRSSMVLVPFVWMDGELCLLFEKRSPNIPQGNEICFPGGAPSAGDLSPEDTAVRETMEELGISRDRIRVDGVLGAFTGALGVIVDVFVGFIDICKKEDFTPNTDEVSRLLFIPFSWFIAAAPERYSLDVEISSVRELADGTRKVLLPARELGLPRQYRDRWPARSHTIYAYRHGGEVIWGMTARMVREIVNLWEKNHDL